MKKNLELCPDCNGHTEARMVPYDRWSCGCWAVGCEGNRTQTAMTKEDSEDEWNRLCIQRAKSESAYEK